MAHQNRRLFLKQRASPFKIKRTAHTHLSPPKPDLSLTAKACLFLIFFTHKRRVERHKTRTKSLDYTTLPQTLHPAYSSLKKYD